MLIIIDSAILIVIVIAFAFLRIFIYVPISVLLSLGLRTPIFYGLSIIAVVGVRIRI